MNRPLCVPGRHAVARPVKNQGFEFGACVRCGHDLVRSRGDWRTVPRGFRVVWRRGPPLGTPDGAQLLLDLPTAGRALALRARRRPRVAVAAELVLLGARCLAWKLADRLRAWLNGLRAPRMIPQKMFSLTAG